MNISNRFTDFFYTGQKRYFKIIILLFLIIFMLKFNEPYRDKESFDNLSFLKSSDLKIFCSFFIDILTLVSGSVGPLNLRI